MCLASVNDAVIQRSDHPFPFAGCVHAGDTEEYGAMVDRMRELYPHHIAIGVGFSMGGNHLLKYLGLSHDNQSKLMCAISCCQGYDVEL